MCILFYYIYTYITFVRKCICTYVHTYNHPLTNCPLAFKNLILGRTNFLYFYFRIVNMHYNHFKYIKQANTYLCTYE